MVSWKKLEDFAASIRKTCSPKALSMTECIVGIDEDDGVFCGEEARIRNMLPCKAVFCTIKREMYGRVCRIWNYLGTKANNDFIVLFGDDIVLMDKNWQSKVFHAFGCISKEQCLPFGAACVAMNDVTFSGFPTFPVIHKWHVEKFGSILPRQFVNQGGDPYLFELYSRFNAARFATTCRLQNTVGGDGDARYKKYEINWRGQILRLNLMHLRDDYLMIPQKGICLDVVVPCYRMFNDVILEKIMRLRCSIPVYVKFWISVDNPNERHVANVKALAENINKERFEVEGNYYVTVLHYGENRGASFARNLGYNYSTADWCLFLDDDVVPDAHLLDAYVGAIMRYPNAKVFVGNTVMPVATNTWTKMLRTCNIMFFYGASKYLPFPPWGVTANLLVRGSRHNNTIQFKGVYPKTGGGEDIDFCFQFKKWYSKKQISRLVVGVPGATALHPWWKNGNVCYGQINGWAWGDSLCITQWPEKCFWAAPNWVEYILLILCPLSVVYRARSCVMAALLVVVTKHFILTLKYFPSACRHVRSGFLYQCFVALGAGTVLSFQEVTRVVAHLSRLHFHCLCRRMDWNDGEDPKVKLDTQLGGFLQFALYLVITWWCVH